ncbi:MAG TPA: SAM-dependent methyltransferase [Clostridiales bacterium]|nr:SAM-dependent methyltransferase [Clostridiales bacterium]
MKLQPQFLEAMKTILDEQEYSGFLASYNQPRNFALRVNTLKIQPLQFLKNHPFGRIERVPWTRDGFYYQPSEFAAGISPGNHPYYFAGLYYLQEPSAMLPAVLLDPKPGERILDLCAAPGGKTLQLAAAMAGEGILVSNEPNSSRCKALVRNIEMYGVRNGFVTQSAPAALAERFPVYFHRILVDAPCSGEGMFRKTPDACRYWDRFDNARCSRIQLEILAQAARMLLPGGRLVYSTCTFSPLENEQVIQEFLHHHPDFHPLTNLNDRIPGDIQAALESRLPGTWRIWPHRMRGEGHFAAVLEKEDETPKELARSDPASPGNAVWKSLTPLEHSVLEEFLHSYLTAAGADLILNGAKLKAENGHISRVPLSCPWPEKMPAVKNGWYLGRIKPIKSERSPSAIFEPSHSMLSALDGKDISAVLNLKLPEHENLVNRYLKGETLPVEEFGLKDGRLAVCVDHYPLGWGKNEGDMLKNLLPPGWRKTR